MSSLARPPQPPVSKRDTSSLASIRTQPRTFHCLSYGICSVRWATNTSLPFKRAAQRRKSHSRCTVTSETPSLRTVGVAYSWFELPHGFRHVSKSHVNSCKNASILKLAGNACACTRGNSRENLDSLLDRGNRKNVKTALRNCIDHIVAQH